MFASKHPNVYSLCVRLELWGKEKEKPRAFFFFLTNASSEIQDGRVWQTNHPPPPPPLCIFTPPTCILLAWLLWSKITQNFPFYKMQAKSGFFILNIKCKSKKSFSAPLSPGRESDMSHSFVSSSSSHTTRNLHTRGTRPKFLLEKHMAIFQGGGIYRRFIKPE